MIKRICLLLALVFCLSACGQKEDDVLIIGALSDVSSVPLFIADHRDLYPSKNIQIQLFHSAAERDAALQSGTIDGAISDVLGAAFAVSGGFDVRITSRTEGQYVLVAAPGRATSMQELDGGSVAISPNTIIEYSVDQLAESANISIKKQIIREMPVRLEMLASGQVDAACLPEPLASGAVLSGGTVVGSSEDLQMDISILLFNKEAVEKKEQLIKDFYKGYDLACDAINGEEDQGIIKELAQVASFPEGVEEVLVLPTYRTTSMIGRESFDKCIEWMVEKELIEQAIAFDDVVYGEFCP